MTSSSHLFYRMQELLPPLLAMMAYGTVVGSIFWQQTDKNAEAAMDLLRGVQVRPVVSQLTLN
jgi:hypothetical protein